MCVHRGCGWVWSPILELQGWQREPGEPITGLWHWAPLLWAGLSDQGQSMVSDWNSWETSELLALAAQSPCKAKRYLLMQKGEAKAGCWVLAASGRKSAALCKRRRAGRSSRKPELIAVLPPEEAAP